MAVEQDLGCELFAAESELAAVYAGVVNAWRTASFDAFASNLPYTTKAEERLLKSEAQRWTPVGQRAASCYRTNSFPKSKSRVYMLEYRRDCRRQVPHHSLDSAKAVWARSMKVRTPAFIGALRSKYCTAGVAEIMPRPCSALRARSPGRLPGRIGSEHIVEVLDLGNLASGDRYMVMEFADGVQPQRAHPEQGPHRSCVDLYLYRASVSLAASARRPHGGHHSPRSLPSPTTSIC